MHEYLKRSVQRGGSSVEDAVATLDLVHERPDENSAAEARRLACDGVESWDLPLPCDDQKRF